ncbi:hypothetical protein [Caballeronia sp. GAWG1-5s-s]|nr:hypothetical protein [Caballeronia sp. GAWG1-5s-s]
MSDVFRFQFTRWYPSMRLYRQTQLGDWSHPPAELQADLHRFCRVR